MTNGKNDEEKKRVEKGLTYNRCPIHGVTYPKGQRCPRCEAEKQDKKE